MSARRALAVVAVAALLAGCTGADPASGPDPSPSPSAEPSARPAADAPLDLGLSEPREDSVYPEVGDPGVDALRYDLDLSWAPGPRVLTGSATVTFRATQDARSFRLDLAAPLRVRRVLLDGERVRARHPGKDLVVAAPVEEDERYELVVDYRGKARPVPAPTRRQDFSTLGWTVTDSGEVWTMQEPYGAHSWYPVNDHPSDKALYAFTISAPDPWTGVANGALVSSESQDGRRITRWETDEPLASYLATIAIGDYAHSSNTSQSGVEIDYWYPRGQPGALADLAFAAEALDWIEARMGPYPFSTLGLVLTDSTSAMETQTMVTLGNTDYTRSPAVIVHELVHQWIGDQVSPSDWRDVWLNEGLTMYLQCLWQADHDGTDVATIMDEYALIDQQLRDEYGPPGDWERDAFGGSNIYYSPALMWHELRLELGDELFWSVVSDWPREHDNQSVDRDRLYDFLEERTDRELSSFFDAWIMGGTTPEREG